MSDSLQTLANYVASALSSAIGHFQTEEDARGFLEYLGWVDVPVIPTALLDLHISLEGVADAQATLSEVRLQFNSGEADDAAVTAALAVLVGQLALAISDIQRLGSAFDAVTPEPYKTESGIAAGIEKRVYDTLVFDFFDESFSFAIPVLMLLGIFEEIPMEADAATHRPTFRFKSVNLDRLGTLLQGPETVMQEVYGWGTPTFREDRLFANLDRLSLPLLFPTEVRFPTQSFLQAVAPGAVISPEDGPPPMLVLTLAASTAVALELGAIATPKASPDEIQGLAFHLSGSGSFSQEFPVGNGVVISIKSEVDLVAGAGAVIRPGGGLSVVTDPDGTPVAFGGGKIIGRVARRRGETDNPVQMLTIPDVGVVEADELFFEASVDATSGPPDILVQAGMVRGRLRVSTAGSDGFTAELVPSEGLVVNFDLGIGWSQRRGVFLTAAAGLETTLPVNQTIGPFLIQSMRLSILADGAGVTLTAGIVGSATLGPVTATLDALGVRALLAFESGNLGPVDLGLGINLPKGYGIAINAGPVQGGGFLFFDEVNKRYGGAVELSVHGIAVKAFGVIDTKLPDGSRGFSFVIVISAEFTPIQLGFGFTLLGVGGVLGINRAIDEKGLRQALLNGSLENVLFPHNVTQRAPEIIDTLTTIMPPAEGKFLFGPMAKIGWGSPTLIRAEIGVMLELPGPLVTILGELHCQLPRPDKALVDLHLSVVGRIDFPQKLLEIDARLRDSKIGPYTVGGQMAMRLRWGRQPSFALAVGGFHPSFQPPSGFPALQPLEVDLGRNGNPSIQLSGFFALTSNTVQVGGALTLHAGGSGISLDAIIAVKAIFVFSPFSFEAQIYAKVKISFHGRGPSVQLHGALSGPSPWRIRGKVCVSILWWDACLGFNKSFGGEERIEEQSINPWTGVTDEILGLQAALMDERSWTPLPPPGAFQVVSLAEAPPDAPESHPFDPMGLAQVRQRVVPLEGTDTKITRFGSAKSSGPERFNLTQVRLETAGGPVDVRREPDVRDFFAPAQYFELDEAKKLSAPSFDEFVAGYTIATDTQDAVVGSSSEPQDTTFSTFVRDSRPNPPLPPIDTAYLLLPDRLIGQSKRALVELVGLRREGTTRYIESGMRSPFGVREPQFTVTRKSDLLPLTGMQPTSQWDAIFAAGGQVSASAALAGFLQVTPLYEMGGP